MIKVAAVAAVALGFAALGSGVASADSIQVEGNYSTLAACQADGPHVQITENDSDYRHWNCVQGDDGLYYLFLNS